MKTKITRHGTKGAKAAYFSPTTGVLHTQTFNSKAGHIVNMKAAQKWLEERMKELKQ